MADEPQTIRSINWRELFPFLHIFRAFRVAVHPSKLLLGLAALLLLYGGGRLMDGLWSNNSSALHGEAEAFENVSRAEDRSVDFAQGIERGRDAHRDAYAQILQLSTEFYRAIVRADAAKADAKKASDAIGDATAKSKAEREASEAYNAAERTAIDAFDLGMAKIRDGLKGGGGGGGPGATPSEDAKNQAKTFAGSNTLKRQIMHVRDRALKNAENRRESAIRDAAPEQDATKKKEKERDARDRFARAERSAFEVAHENVKTVDRAMPRGIFGEFLEYEVNQLNGVVAGVKTNNWTGGLDSRKPEAAERRRAAVAAPEMPDGVVRSIINFFSIGPAWLFRHHLLYAILFTALFLGVWAVFGGAIARIAAVHVARDEKISVRQALRFSISKVLSFIFAPLIPLLIVLGIGVIMALGGLLFYVPWIGPILAGALFILALLGGVVITLVLFGTVGGMNLMYPTVAVEGSDSFDAISRSFSYVFARPWRMLFYTLVAIVYGALTYLFVKFFIYIVLASTHFFVGWFLGGQAGRWFPELWPEPSMTSLPYDVMFSGLAWSEIVAAALIMIWNFLLIGLLGAFAISFYFSANTIIYYLMRREVDATELDDVYVEESDEDLADTAPVAAIASPVGASPVASTSAPGGGESGAAGSSPPGGSGETPPAGDNPPQG